MPGGLVVSVFKVRCMRSWRPFCCGLSGLDALDRDAEAEPPDGEPGEIEEAVGAGEGQAVVGADGVGQAALLEEALEGGDGWILARGLQGFAQRRKREAWSVTVSG